MHNNNIEFLAKKLQYGITIQAVIDVSYHPTYQYGTSTWIIKIHNNDGVITGDDVVLGGAKYQCSHRSELCVIIGAIQHIYIICSTYKVLEGSLELGCD